MVLNDNQHYVSQVLQRRFADGGYLQRFDLKWNKWKRVSTRGIFSKFGYSQLLIYGEYDNSVDEQFKPYEQQLNNTLAALDGIAKRGTTEQLADDVSKNLFWYCAFLWSMSPFVKAMAPLEYALGLELDLKNGISKRLEELGMAEADIVTIRLMYAKGSKFIPAGENHLQVLFRIQFRLNCANIYHTLRHYCNWTLYNSPINMPIADVPFFKFNDHGKPINIFAISPSLVLVGKVPMGLPVHHKEKTELKTDTLTIDEAEYIRDAICLSALTAVASKDRSIDVLAARKRAKERGISFPIIKNLDAVMSAGLTEFNDLFRIVPVSDAEYTKWKQSFFEPIHNERTTPV